MSQENPVEVRFYPPPADLRRYFTTFYRTTITLPAGETVLDSLQPEWAGLRIFDRPGPDAWIEGKPVLSGARFIATGPSSCCTYFRVGSLTFWGIGLLPLGWAQFVRQSASAHANLIADGLVHPSFRHFAPLTEGLFTGLDEHAELDRIVAFFRDRLDDPPADAQRISEIHSALVDPEVATVSELVSRIGASQRTIERTADRAFGFSPKLMLRRQRFMRSLAQFMLDPSLKWIGAIDGHYHDQAQFVRDFHDFMGMSPREYAALPHPILDTFIRERARVAGAGVQTLDPPGGVAHADEADRAA